MTDGAYIAQLFAAAFFVLVGSRLLLLSQRTGEKPEKMLGLYFFATGLSYVGWLIPTIFHLTSIAEQTDLAAWTLYGIGVVPLLIFARVAFRPNEGWAKWIVGSCTLFLLVGTTAWIIQATGYYTIESPWFWCQWLGYTLPCLWVTIEAMLCYSRANKRLRIGLCTPIVANRYLLFGLFGVFQTFACMTDVYLAMDYVAVQAISGGIDLLLGVFEMIGILMLFLAFFPPKGFRVWISGDAERAVVS